MVDHECLTLERNQNIESMLLWFCFSLVFLSGVRPPDAAGISESFLHSVPMLLGVNAGRSQRPLGRGEGGQK